MVKNGAYLRSPLLNYYYTWEEYAGNQHTFVLIHTLLVGSSETTREALIDGYIMSDEDMVRACTKVRCLQDFQD